MLQEFRDSIMFHKVRGRVFSEVEMDKYKIRGIYNMVGDVESMGFEVVQNFCAGCLRPGSSEICFIESSLKDSGKGNPLKVVSVMVFGDRFIAGSFALKEGLREHYYHEGEYDEPILGLLN